VNPVTDRLECRVPLVPSTSSTSPGPNVLVSPVAVISTLLGYADAQLAAVLGLLRMAPAGGPAPEQHGEAGSGADTLNTSAGGNSIGTSSNRAYPSASA
jgi:hypothetical protein